MALVRYTRLDVKYPPKLRLFQSLPLLNSGCNLMVKYSSFSSDARAPTKKTMDEVLISRASFPFVVF